MKKSHHKLFVLSSLTLAIAAVFLLASAHAQAKPRDTAFMYAGICRGTFDGVKSQIKLLLDPDMYCATHGGPFKALLLTEDVKSESNLGLEVMSAMVSQVGDSLQFSSEIGFEDDKVSASILLTLPARTPSKDEKGTLKMVVTTPEEGTLTTEDTVLCDLTEYMMACGAQ